MIYFFLFNVLWVSNIITLYYIILPFSWKFFLSYQSTSILEKSTSFFFEAKIQEYIYFIYELYYICFIFNVFFYFIIFFIQKFSFNKKYIYLIIFIFSTVITPPDVISQLMLSCVLIVIIEIYLYYNIFLNNLRKPIKTY
ncbi:MAG: twin-arginine translocase subunit TatC [Pelagibacterales bacterium]|nr:twin-arginine translocase subunit TatC [Pelagibacterales bacterium]